MLKLSFLPWFLSQVEYDEAVELALAGAMRDLQESSQQVQKLKQETQENAKGSEVTVVKCGSSLIVINVVCGHILFSAVMILNRN